MNGRFGAAIVAFALAAALVSRGPMLSEFLVQLRDPNMFGGALFGWTLHAFGYAFVLALCGVLAAAAVLLAAWRTRMRGATDWHASLAAALVALCMSARAGVSLDPVGWLCAAAFALLLERDDDRSSVALVAVTAVWALLQGGATLASLLILCSIAGRLADEGTIDKAFRRRLVFLGVAMLAGVVQLHGFPFHAYGAHALYLDALKSGAQRDRLWNGDIGAASVGFSAIVVVAAWYGLRRRGRTADAVAFLTMLVLCLIDARMLPYFGIVAAPAAVDALASYYVLARSSPRGGALRYAPALLAAGALFIAAIAISEPKADVWPPGYNEPVALLAFLQSQPGDHRVLCTRPRWCDGVRDLLPGASVLADDRSGITPTANLHAEALVSNAASGWKTQLQASHVDSVIASEDDSVVALLLVSGWHVGAGDGTRVLLQRRR
jgi:hypothetical protein